MGETGVVTGLYVASNTGEPMEFTDYVEMVAGYGIQDDRYALGRGLYSRTKPKIRHVSLISSEAITAANLGSVIPFTEADTLRNIVTLGVDLNRLVDVQFTIGDIELRGTELCNPCDIPSRRSGKPGFREAFKGRGGLRAEVLTSGPIVVGEVIRT